MLVIRLRYRNLASLFFVSLFTTACLPRANCQEDNLSLDQYIDTFAEHGLQQHVDYLADDARTGRETGTEGNRQAGNYIRSCLKNNHLVGAGEGGSFVQPVRPNGQNILGMIEGCDPKLKHEIVLVCAHYDHVGMGNEENSVGPFGYIHNGADDNASGVAAVLELAKAIAMMQKHPRRSILFAFWDAEEMGMLGSKHWAAHPTLPLDCVVAAINLDMVGRLRNNRLTLYGTRSGLGFRRLVSLQNTTLELEIDYSWELEDDSDHYAFYQAGIPVLFLHTGLHSQYHSPEDDAQLINYRGLNRVTRLLFRLVHEFGNQATKPLFRVASRKEQRFERLHHSTNIKSSFSARLGFSWRTDESEPGTIILTHVEADSPANRSNLSSGDRIYLLNGEHFVDEREFLSCIKDSNEELQLQVESNGQVRNITLFLEDSPKILSAKVIR